AAIDATVDLQVYVFTVYEVRVQGVSRRKSTVAAEHRGIPVGSAGRTWGRPIHERAVVLRATNNTSRRTDGGSVELRDAIVGVHPHQAIEWRRGKNIIVAIDAAVVAEKNDAIGRAVIARMRDYDVLIGMG